MASFVFPDADTADNLVAFGGNNTGGPIDVATALSSHGGPHGRQDFESETFVAEFAPAISASNPYGDFDPTYIRVMKALVGDGNEYPGCPKFGPKKWEALLERYGERIRGRLEAGKAAGEVSAALDIDAAVILFVGSLQGLIMQSMLAGDLLRIRRDAPRVFAIYLAGIRSAT